MKKLLMVTSFLFAFTMNTHLSNYIDPVRQHEQEQYAYLMSKLNEDIPYNFLRKVPVISPLKLKDIIRISDVFGYRANHPILHKPTFHNGIDFSAKLGTNVRATLNGTITKVNRSRKGYGNMVVIQHDNNYSTVYAHLHKIDVEVGDSIITGQTIGTVGNSGLSTGPHLHYEIRLNNEPIDPLNLYQISLDEEEQNQVKDYLALLNEFESVLSMNT